MEATTMPSQLLKAKLLRTEVPDDVVATTAEIQSKNTRGRSRLAANGAVRRARSAGEADEKCVKTEMPSEAASSSKVSKATVHRIITDKTLQSEVKLPTGIDPNTNFNCSVRLDRLLLTSDMIAGIAASTPAGLFSDSDEQDHPQTSSQHTHGTHRDAASVGNSTIVPIGIAQQTNQQAFLPFLSRNYRQIRTNVYAESVRPNLAGLDHPICDCLPYMCCGDDCLNRVDYTECMPSSCPAREHCRNQVIQRHETAPGIERFRTLIKGGWGVRTTRPIPRGTFILEYVGEVVTESMYKERTTTLYAGDSQHYGMYLEDGLIIDSHRMGNESRFVNHSCKPNCEIQKWSVKGLSCLALFALRDISSFEELSYDYNFLWYNSAEIQVCRCNAEQCRGVIGGKSQRVRPLPAVGDGTQVQSMAVAVASALSNGGSDGNGSGGANTLPGPQRKRKAHKSAKQRAAAKKRKKSVAAAKKPTECEKTLVRNLQKVRSQISGLCCRRSIMTRAMTHVLQDPKVERMARMTLVLRDICAALDAMRDPSDDQMPLIIAALCANSSGGSGAASGRNKKRKALKTAQLRQEAASDLKAVQSLIERGYYKRPAEFDEDVLRIMATARQTLEASGDGRKLAALDTLQAAYTAQKQLYYVELLELLGGDETALVGFIDQKQQQQPQGELDHAAAIVVAAGYVAVGEAEQTLNAGEKASEEAMLTKPLEAAETTAETPAAIAAVPSPVPAPVDVV